MSILTSFLKKLTAASLALQVLFVALAFAAMVILSYLLVAGIERRHLANDAGNALSYAQAKIEAELNRAETMAAGVSQTIHSMLLRGASLSETQKYLQEMDDYAYSSGFTDFGGFFGHFEAFGGVNVDGTGRYLPEGVAAEGRPWYIAAESAGGKITATDPYFSLNTNSLVVTYVRRIYGEDGKPLCITGMNITFSEVAQHVRNISEYARSEGTYGILYDRNLMMVVHPNPDVIGKMMNEMDGTVASLEKELLSNGVVEEREVINLAGKKSIIFFRTMSNGWQLGVLTLKNIYYRNTKMLALYLSSFGALLAAFLSYILMCITREKRRADEFTQIVFDAMPLACDLWDRERNNVMCNNEAVRLYGARSKQDYLDKFFDFSPEYQPSGKRSRDLCREVVDKAFTEGYSHAEWMHKTWDGKPLPCEIIMVRIMYKGDLAVLAYKRDLREEKAALDRVREADERAHSMFDAAPLGITMWDINGNLMDCNMEAARVTGVSSKQEYIDKFQELTPEHQSDGRKSFNVIKDALVKTFKEGYCSLVWEHNTINGETVSFDTTCVRLKYRDGFVVVSYSRDLRDLHAEMEKTRAANELTQAIFNAAPFAITMWEPTTYTLLDCNLEAMRLVDITDKKVYIDTFAQMAPEYQPDGRKTADTLAEVFGKTMADGAARHMWEHRTLSGEPIPFNVNTVRLKHNGGHIIISYAQDMREINAAIAKMRKTDEFTQVMFKAMPLACHMWNTDLRCVMCNDEAMRVYRAADRQYFLDNFFDFSPERQPGGRRSKEKGEEHLRKGFEDGYFRFEWVHKRGDGEEFPCEITMIRAMYGGEPALLTYTRDLSEEKAAMEKLREADERAIMMLDAAPIGVTLWDRNMNLIDFNYEAVRVVGIHSKPEYREKFGELTPEFQPDGKKSVDVLAKFFDRAFKGGQSKTLWYHNNSDGEGIPFDATAIRLKLKYKDEDVVMVCCRDLREIYAANDNSRKAEERAEILLNAAPVGCVLYNETQTALECNPEALKLFGLSEKEQFLSAGVRAFSAERQPDGALSNDKINEMTSIALEKGYNRFEWIHVNAAGEEVPCDVTLLRVKHRGKDIIASYMRDLREYKAIMEEKHRTEIAEESNKAKSRFLATMSHEIRTPMNVILGVTEIQLQDEHLPPHLREAFLQVYNSSNLLLGIINDILDLSKIEAGKMEFTPAGYKLASLINDTVHLNMMRNSKPIEFELEVDENAPANLYGDELRIKQILNNLLSNAFKFTGEGRIKLTVAVEGGAGAGGEQDVTLVLTVSDTGQGMAEDQLRALFSEYTRFNLSTNRAIEGTGLGMNITRNLVNMMGGNINVDSAFGKGTTVKVCLPQKCTGTERIGGELAENMRQFRVNATAAGLAKNHQITREYMPYGKVLIVDDVESNLYVAKGLMAPYGLAVDTATSGSKAVEKVKSGEVYDIIFMDHMMPGMDGIEAAKIIREYGYTNPIVALTANAVVGQAEMFLSSGFDDFISKPIDIRQLNATLNKLIRDKQPAEVIEHARSERDKLDKTSVNYAAEAATPELLAIFARDARRVMPAMEDISKNAGSASPDEIHLFTVGVHAMKSALANIGETRLSQMAFSLERAGKAGDKNKIAIQLPSFVKALREIVVKAEEAGKAKPAAEKDENPAFLREQMALINKACSEYDEKSVDAALDRLKKMSWTTETESVLDKISLLLLHSDFDEAAEAAKGLLDAV